MVAQHAIKMLSWLIFALLLVSAEVHAELYNPTNIGGSIGYVHRITDYDGKNQQSSDSLSLSMSGAGYIFQPWLMSLDYSLTMAESLSSYGANVRSAGYGVGLRFLPMSRHPTTIRYTYSDPGLLGDDFGILHHSKSGQNIGVTESLLITQALNGPGYSNTLSYSINSARSEQNNKSTSLNFNHSYSALRSHRFSVQASNSEQFTNSERDRTGLNLNLSHLYSTGGRISVSTNGTHSESESFLTDQTYRTQVDQVGSYLTWNSEDNNTSASVSGVVAEAQTETSNSLSGQSSDGVTTMSLNTNINQRVSKNSSVSAGMNYMHYVAGDSGALTTTDSQSLGYTYNGDGSQYKDLSYFWGTGFGVGRSHSVSDSDIGDKQETETLSSNGSISHSLSYSNNLSRYNRLSMSAQQSVGLTENESDTQGQFSQGANAGLNSRSFLGISTISIGINESLPLLEVGVVTQNMRISANLNRPLSRSSSGTVNYSGTRFVSYASSNPDDKSELLMHSVSASIKKSFSLYLQAAQISSTFTGSKKESRFKGGETSSDFVYTWNNDAQWSAGRMLVSLTTRTFEQEQTGDIQTNIMMSIKRSF